MRYLLGTGCIIYFGTLFIWLYGAATGQEFRLLAPTEPVIQIEEEKSEGIEVICIWWTDATGFDETWVEVTEDLKPAEMVSCGHFALETEKGTYLALDKAEDDTYAQIGFIPAKWVEKRVTVPIQ